MAPPLTAIPIEPASLDELASALEGAALPTADISGPDRIFFRFETDSPIGFGGIEGDGPDRLLRSLVVLDHHRGAGHGRAIVRLIEQQAAARGVARLHLLTLSAAPFFAAQGYAETPRSAAPASIAASAEFTALCPASATYFTKILEPLV